MTDDKFACAVVRWLHEHQTDDEKENDKTTWKNGEGWDAIDARRFGPLARKIINNGSVSAEELAPVRRLNKRGQPLLVKYWRQIWPALEFHEDRPPRRPPQKEEHLHEDRKEEVA